MSLEEGKAPHSASEPYLPLWLCGVGRDTGRQRGVLPGGGRPGITPGDRAGVHSTSRRSESSESEWPPHGARLWRRFGHVQSQNILKGIYLLAGLEDASAISQDFLPLIP